MRTVFNLQKLGGGLWILVDVVRIFNIPIRLYDL